MKLKKKSWSNDTEVDPWTLMRLIVDPLTQMRIPKPESIIA